MKKEFKNYELIEEKVLEDLNSTGYILRHKKSGARVVVVSNDDENKVFSIGFRTPPTNDTGLQHILEHSVLCGSRKYSVKDPFVELCKGSLNTFLNAMTYPDKTIYPVASCNDVDFKNIMDVYMDAVFYPNIYTKPQIFKQEGWHYEIEDEKEPIEYNGVVYNEMKGVYSSPDDILSRYTFTSLFPDTAYRFESGGEPGCIPTLSYEEFLEYHRNYYHPVNSYIYLYGNIDIEERLEYLDRDYLSNFDKNEVNIQSEIQLQKSFEKMVTEVHYFPITEEESLEDNSYLSWNTVVGTTMDAKLYLAMQIIDYALVSSPGAKIKQALIDKGIGDDIYSSYESSLRQPMYSITSKDANESQMQEFVDTIMEVFTDVVNNGIDKKVFLAGINFYEFKYREADFGPYPKGLMYGLQMLDSWLYDDKAPFIHIEAGNTFNELKNEVENGFFEEVIKKYLIDNTHASLLALVPKKNLLEEQEEKVKKELADYKASLSEEEIKALVQDTVALKKYQDEPSPQEDLESIPMLALEDIKKTPTPIYNEKRVVDGTDVIFHDLFTNKIAYMMLSFNCKNIPEELVPYLGLLGSTLGLMDTTNFSYADLVNEININSGGISTGAAIYTDNKDLSLCTIRYEVKSKVLYEKIDFSFDMIKEILFETKFDDYKRLKEIIARSKSRLESSMTGSGHSVAMLGGMAQFSKSGYYSNAIRGYGYYELITDLDKNFDTRKEDIVSKLRELVELIFLKDNLVVSLTSNEDGFKQFTAPAKDFINTLSCEPSIEIEKKFEPVNVKTALTSSSQVQYVARCGNYNNEGFEYTGALRILKVIFSYDYLWINVRVKGGAYGCMSAFYKNGDTYLVSYRDPNLAKTNEIYEGAPEYIRNFTVSDRDMLKYIIGTIGEMDTPLNPSALGTRSFSAYLSHADISDFQRERDQILEATQEDIRNLAPLIESVIKQNYLFVVGNNKVINDEAQMFDKIEGLLLN